MQIYTLSCGSLEFNRQLFFPQSETADTMVVPVFAYLISHPKGYVLFDTGVHPHASNDPYARLGARIAGSYTCHTKKNENIVSQLELVGVSPGDIRYVVNSHLHFDHCGANGFFQDSVFLVQEREMQSVRAGGDRFKLLNVNHPGEYRLIDGEFDVYGDGRLHLLPTFGHSPGHQSLLVDMGRGGKTLLVGDACYTREHLAGNLLPETVWDVPASYAGLRLLHQLEKEGVGLCFSHDRGSADIQ